LVSVGITVSTTLIPASSPYLAEVALQQPQIIESVNIAPPPNYNLELPEKGEEIVDASETQELENESPLSSPPSPEPSEPVIDAVTAEVETKKETPNPSAKPEEKTSKVLAAATEKPKEKVKAEEKPTEKKESPSPIPMTQKLADGAEKLFQMANEHRKSIGLPAFEKEERICKMAESRAPQVHAEVFGGAGPIHKGFRALNLPYWATENAAAYESVERNFKFWMSDYIHKKAIEGPSKYSCVACSGSSCSQIFTSFIPKD
jgi:uncharacterized protein YkwD